MNRFTKLAFSIITLALVGSPYISFAQVFEPAPVFIPAPTPIREPVFIPAPPPPAQVQPYPDCKWHYEYEDVRVEDHSDPRGFHIETRKHIICDQ